MVVVDQEPFNGEDMSPAPVPEPEAMTADVGGGGDEEGQQNGFTEDGLAVAMAVDAGEEDDSSMLLLSMIRMPSRPCIGTGGSVCTPALPLCLLLQLWR